MKTSLPYLLTTIAWLLIPQFSFAQNLFPNPDFELMNDCPDSYSGINIGDCVAWSCIAGSPDYFNCSFYGNSGNPTGGIASSGSGAVGMYGLLNNLSCSGELQRESMMATLVEPLKECMTYEVTFDLRLDIAGAASNPGFGHGCLGFGFYFYSGTDPNLCANSCGCWNVEPQVVVPADQVPFDQFETFTARFLSYGNYDKVAVGPYCLDTMASSSCYAAPENHGPFELYFNLDNIHLYADDKNDIGSSKDEICQGDTITFYENRLDSVYDWNWSASGGTLIDDFGDSISYFFDEAGTYTISLLTQSDCDTLFHENSDTIRVYPTYPNVDLASPITLCKTQQYVIPNSHSELNYLWSDQITGASRHFDQNETIHVNVTDNFGCHQSEDTLQVVLSSALNLFPNPTSSRVTLEGELQTPNQLTLLDAKGALVLRAFDVTSLNLNLEELDLRSGCYFVLLNQADCVSTTRLIFVR